MPGETGADRGTTIQNEISTLLLQLPEDIKVATLSGIIRYELPRLMPETLQELRNSIDSELLKRTQVTGTRETPSLKSAEASQETSSSALNEIDKSILDRHIFGKFQGKVVLHGTELFPEGYNATKSDDYVISPKASRVDLDPTGQFTAVNELFRRGIHYKGNGSEIERTLGSCHVFAYRADPVNPSLSRLQMIYSPEYFDRVNRPALSMQIVFKLPTDKLEKLVAQIKENPDSAEDFYKISTGEFDNSVRRFKADKIALIDVDTFMPLDKFTGNVQVHQMVTNYQNRLNKDGLTVLSYSTPHGKVDRVQ